MSPNSHAFWSKKENRLGDADIVVVVATAIGVVASVLMCVSES